MTGAITDLSTTPPPENLTTEVLIIGSGSGGATAAWDLAEAGHEVVVLEEGGDFTRDKLTQRDALYDQLYMDRGGRATEDLSVTILQGRVLGGGGVINASDVVTTPDEVLEFWGERFGLTDFSPAALKPYQARALADLRANRIPEQLMSSGNKLVKEATERLGLEGEIMQHNRRGCAGLGVCMVGCPIDAKKNPRLVAIPMAMESGARFFTRARAVRIDDAKKELKKVTVRCLDEKGYHERELFTIQAKVVICTANAIASAQLLLKSDIGNRHVGQHLTLQPQLPISAIFKSELASYRGIPQAYAVTEHEEVHPEHGLWGFRMEPIHATPGITAATIPIGGAIGKEYMAAFGRMTSALLLTPDDPSGTVVVNESPRPVVQYSHRDNHKERLKQAIKLATRIYLEAGAEYVEVPMYRRLSFRSEKDLKQVDALEFPPASAPLISAHQQGTVRFSPNERDGGANPDGLVYGTQDIYVFDTSGFPTSSSSHTMAPTIAFAHYLTDKLITHL